jgi:DUF4097 and DUF4098 domain-containing protein YvlB
MKNFAIVGAILAAATTFAAGNDSTREAKLAIVPGGVVTVANSSGSVALRQGTQHQVVVTITTHSDKVEVDANSTADGKRVEIVAHPLPQRKPSSNESKVDLDLSVPAGISVTITTATAPITVENVSGDLSLSSDTGTMTVKNAANSHLQVRGVAAPVVLSNVTGHVQVTSSGGPVQFTDVSGPKVNIGTISGNISFHGDFSGGGFYVFTTHSGAIDVVLPATASVDLTARSVKGSVENDYPLQTKTHLPFIPSEGRSFAGTSNSGSSSVELQSFSGRIRVKKQ